MKEKPEKLGKIIHKRLNALEDAITSHKVSLATVEARFADCVAAIERFIAINKEAT